MGRPESRDKFHPPTLEFEEELDEKELFERAMEGVRPLARIDHRFGNEGDFGRPERFSESFAIDPVQVE